MKSRLRTLAFALLCLALVTCETPMYRVSVFEPVKSVPPDRALVYIYRPERLWLSESEYSVYAKDREVVWLSNGGYYPLLIEPKRTLFWAALLGTYSITLDLEPGKTYYLEGSVRWAMGWPTLIGTAEFGIPRLTLVDPSVGAEEIKDCILLEPSGP